MALSMRKGTCPACGQPTYNRCRGYGDDTLYCSGSLCRWASAPYRLGSGIMFYPTPENSRL